MRPHRNPIQVVEWSCTQQTYWQYQELVQMLEELSPDCQEFQGVVEEIKSLPNFPHGIDTEYAHIFPVVTNIQFN